jgi:hypothetical protein
MASTILAVVCQRLVADGRMDAAAAATADFEVRPPLVQVRATDAGDAATDARAATTDPRAA